MLFIVFNILLIGIIVLIAYWWANQGLFSALLHLLCVIVAGALAFAFWEPLTVGLLLRGGLFDEYAWGVSLVGLFVVALALLRTASDKLIPSNVDLPNWANLVFGFPVGALAGILTVGIWVIGIGHVATQRDFMGLNGWQRDSSGQPRQIEPIPFWCHAPQITSGFYSMLSGGALSTSTPLRAYNPALYQQATLLRDGYTTSRGELVSKLSVRPDAVAITGVLKSPETNEYAVVVEFQRKAFDGGGQQLALSASQIRLIGSAGPDGEAPFVFPKGWSQYVSTASIAYLNFDTNAHFATSIPGRETAELMFVFPMLPNGVEPKFLQVRGTRLRVPPAVPPNDALDGGQFEARKFTLGKESATDPGATETKPDPTRPTVPREEVAVNASLPVYFSTNTTPGGISLQAKGERSTLFEGKATIQRPEGRPPRKMLVDSMFEQPNTKLVQLDVSRRTVADVYGFLKRTEGLGEGAMPMLVDSQGNTYRALGFIHQHGAEEATVMIDRQEGVGSLKDLPSLPSSGEEKLKLIFEIPVGVELVSFRLNNIVVANLALRIAADTSSGFGSGKSDEEEEEVP